MIIPCKLCHKPSIFREGWFNFSDIFIPLCKDHMKEYLEFKEKWHHEAL